MNKRVVVIASIALATIAVSATVYYSCRSGLPRVKLGRIHFDHANNTYTGSQNISVWMDAVIRTKGTMFQLTAFLTVKDNSRKEVYEDKIASGRWEFLPVERKPAYTVTRKITCTFWIEETGEYEVSVAAYVDGEDDTVTGTFKVVP